MESKICRECKKEVDYNFFIDYPHGERGYYCSICFPSISSSWQMCELRNIRIAIDELKIEVKKQNNPKLEELLITPFVSHGNSQERLRKFKTELES